MVGCTTGRSDGFSAGTAKTCSRPASRKWGGLRDGGPAVAACGNETTGGLDKMLMASQDVDQMVDVGAAMSGVQLDSKPR